MIITSLTKSEIAKYKSKKATRLRTILRILLITSIFATLNIVFPFIQSKLQEGELLNFEKDSSMSPVNQIVINNGQVKGYFVDLSENSIFKLSGKFTKLPYETKYFNNLRLHKAYVEVEKKQNTKNVLKLLQKDEHGTNLELLWFSKIDKKDLDTKIILDALDISLNTDLQQIDATGDAFSSFSSNNLVVASLSQFSRYNFIKKDITLSSPLNNQSVIWILNKNAITKLMSDKFYMNFKNNIIKSDNQSQFVIQKNNIKNISKNDLLLKDNIFNEAKILNNGSYYAKFANFNLEYDKKQKITLTANKANIIIVGKSVKDYINTLSEHFLFISDKEQNKIFFIKDAKIYKTQNNKLVLKSFADFIDINELQNTQNNNNYKIRLKDNVSVFLKSQNQEDIKIVSNDLSIDMKSNTLTFNDKVFLGYLSYGSVFTDGLKYDLTEGSIDITNKTNSRKTLILKDS
jgi:hypothetical protein